MSDHNPSDLKGEARRDRERAQRDDVARVLRERDVRWLMEAGPKGRAFAYNFLKEAGVWDDSFSSNALVMARNEGRRSVGMKLMNAIHKVCPDAYLTMLNEHREQQTRAMWHERDRATASS